MYDKDWPPGFLFVPPFPVNLDELDDVFPREFQIVATWIDFALYDKLASRNRQIARLALNDPSNPILGDAAKVYRRPIEYAEQQKKTVRAHLERLCELPSGELVPLIGSERIFVDYDRRRFAYERRGVFMRGKVKKGEKPITPFGAMLLTALASDPGVAQHEEELCEYIWKLRGLRDADKPAKLSNHIDNLRDSFYSQVKPDDNELFHRMFESKGMRSWRLNLDPAEVRLVPPRMVSA